jgi:hypothetical protein
MIKPSTWSHAETDFRDTTELQLETLRASKIVLNTLTNQPAVLHHYAPAHKSDLYTDISDSKKISGDVIHREIA